jgi:CRP-like cAMP-binding protein
MHPLRQHIEKITPLSTEEFDYILGHFTEKKLRKHQYLIQDSDLVQNDYWVLEGCLKAYHLDREGKTHILQFATEDWWISDYQAYFYQSPATIWADAIENCTLLSLSLTNREKLCSELHKMEHFFRKKSNSGYVALQNRILSLLNSSAEERFHQFSNQYPSLLQRLPKTIIASYLGVSRETLSRFSK